MVIVVGAGICGLAAAYELTKRGEEVVVLERAAPGGEQSAGLGRIFRIAHGQARLCALAQEAREGWRRWEAELGVHLLGEEGLVIASPRPETVAAMDEAGAEWREVRVREHVPFAADGEAILDPAAGSLRIRRAIGTLTGRVEIRRAEVISVGADGSVALREPATSAGTGTSAGAVTAADAGALTGAHAAASLRGDAVVICAGERTPVLAATAGIDVQARFTPHVRLTYRGRGACFISPHGYGVPLGSTGTWAFGLHDGHDQDVLERTRERHGRVVPELFPGLDPAPVGEVRCVNVHAPWLDAGGDGWFVARNGRAIAFTGANLMKFGPVIGERLARTVLAGNVDADLGVPG